MPAPLPLDEAVDRYLDHLKVERNLSPRSIEAYARDLRQLVTALLAAGVGDAGAVEPHHLSGFLLGRARGGAAGRSRARAVSAFRGLWRFLRGERLLDADPTAAIESPRLARRLPAVLSLAEVDRLLAAPALPPPAGPRDAAMIATP